MSNLFIFLFAWLIYICWNIPEYNGSTAKVDEKVLQRSMCPTLPENYFVVETREEIVCDSGTEKSILTKVIRESKVIK